MTINELIEKLENYREEFGGEIEVRTMTQEHYPFEHSIAGVTSLEEINEEEEDGDGFKPASRYGWTDRERVPEAVVYLLEGSQLGHGTKSAWRS